MGFSPKSSSIGHIFHDGCCISWINVGELDVDLSHGLAYLYSCEIVGDQRVLREKGFQEFLHGLLFLVIIFTVHKLLS